MLKDLYRRIRSLTGWETAWFGALLAGILFSTLLLSHFLLTRPYILEKRTLNCAEALGALLQAREIRAETPRCILLSGVTAGGVPAAQLKLQFETRFPGLFYLKSAQISGAELQVDPVTGEVNGKAVLPFLQEFRSHLPVLLLPRRPDQQFAAEGYLESGSRSSSFRFECRKLEDGFQLEFRSGSNHLSGLLSAEKESWNAVFSGAGSFVSPLPGALPEGTVLSGEADWRWELFRRGKGPQQSILSGRFGADGGTILLRGAALRFAPGSEIRFNCAGDGFSGTVSKGTLLSPRVELQDFAFQSQGKDGLGFSGWAGLAQAPGVEKGGLEQPVRVRGDFVPQAGTLRAEAAIGGVSPDVFLPLQTFLPGKNVPEKLRWSLEEDKGRGAFRVECDFRTLRFGKGGTAEKAKLTLQSRLYRTDSGYILPESRTELTAKTFRESFCDFQDFSLVRTVHGGNASYEAAIGSGRCGAGKNGEFTVRNGKVRFREAKGAVNGTLEAEELRQTIGKECWTVHDPVLSFRYALAGEDLSLAGHTADLCRSGGAEHLEAQDCTVEASCGKSGWEGTLQAASLRRSAPGTIPLKLQQARLRNAAGLLLVRSGTVAGRWQEAEFSARNFQMQSPGEFRCEDLQFQLAQAWEGTGAAVELQNGSLRCSGFSLRSTAQKKRESLALSGMDLLLQGSSGTLQIGRLEAPGNWCGSARLNVERTPEGLRFFGPLLAESSRDTLMLSGDVRYRGAVKERIRAAFRRAPRKLPGPLTLTPSADRNAVLVVTGRTGISGEYHFGDRAFSGSMTYQLMDANLAMEQDFVKLAGVKTELVTDFATGRMQSVPVPLRFASGVLGKALHVGSGEAKLQIRGHGFALRELQTMAMGGTLQAENPLDCNGTPYHQLYFKAATIRPAELAGGGFALRCDGTFRVGNGEFGCTLKGGNGHLRLAPLAPFASQEKSTLNDFVQAALTDFRVKVLQLDYLGCADGSGKMHVFATGSPEKPLPFVFDEVRQKFSPLDPGEPGFLGEIDLAVDYAFPSGGTAGRP